MSRIFMTLHVFAVGMLVVVLSATLLTAKTLPLAPDTTDGTATLLLMASDKSDDDQHDDGRECGSA